MTHSDRLAHTDPLFMKCNILKVLDQLNFNKSCFTFKAIQGEVPIKLESIVQKHCDTESQVLTRMSQSSQLIVPFTKSKWYDSFPSVTFAKNWNSLPGDVRDISLFRIFRQTLLCFYLDQYNGLALIP